MQYLQRNTVEKAASQHLAMEENPENDQPEPINVTGELTIQDRMKLVSGISREIKHQVIALIKQYGSHFNALIGWVHSNSLRFSRFTVYFMHSLVGCIFTSRDPSVEVQSCFSFHLHWIKLPYRFFFSADS